MFVELSVLLIVAMLSEFNPGNSHVGSGNFSAPDAGASEIMPLRIVDVLAFLSRICA